MPGIDAHTHLFAPEQLRSREQLASTDSTFAEMYGDPAARMATAPDLLAALDEAHLEAAVAAGFAFSSEAAIGAQNEYLLEAARISGGRIVALATINLALSGWEHIVSRAVDLDARGFGELRPHNQGWDPLGKQAQRLCGMAKDAGLVLVWHCSEPAGHTYPGKAGGISPVELMQLVTLVPGVSQVGAHLGAGLSFYLQMPEVKAALESVYFDTAAYSLLYDDESVARLVDLAGPERVIFGSDYPLLSPRRQIERLAAQLSSPVADAVCGGNARRLFRITDSHD